MNDALFDCCASKVVPSSTAVVTPLATLAMSFHSVKFETVGLNPDEEYALQNGARLKRFSSPEGTVDLLMGAIRPQLPPHLRTDGCVAAIWRVRANTRLRELRFSCSCAVQSSEADGSPNSGEGLDAFTWRFDHRVLSIGTEDGEVLAARASRSANMPPRLACDLNMSTVTYTSSGIEVPFSYLEPGELLQIHFVVAWAGHYSDESPSTWFAVDQKPEHLLRQLTATE
jgi:hypothetical protein